MVYDGSLNRIEGLVLFVSLLVYVIFCIRAAKSEPAVVTKQFEEAVPQTAEDNPRWMIEVAFVFVGLAGLALGSKLFVGVAVEVARTWGISELVIGLTIVATGTSLPEVVTSIVASIRGEADVAVGNVVGSNLFNLLGVLGLTASVSLTPLPISQTVMTMDLPVMLAMSVICIPVFWTGRRVSRIEGGLMLLGYAVYLGLILN